MEVGGDDRSVAGAEILDARVASRPSVHHVVSLLTSVAGRALAGLLDARDIRDGSRRLGGAQ
jgi:hypothetical protein